MLMALSQAYSCPCRVWYTTRVTGTHTKTLTVFGNKFKPTHKTVLGGPEQQSLVFNDQGQVKIFTGGQHPVCAMHCLCL